MKHLFELVGITAQAFSQERKRRLLQQELAAQVVQRCEERRATHQEMGCRKLYFDCLQNLPVGRDKCEQILMEHGFRVRYPKNFTRTTQSARKGYFPNLIKGIELTGPDQLWQSDITYVQKGNVFYYAVFIIDVYTRCILGAAVADNMRSSLIMKALRQAFKKRQGKNLEGLIFHSDRGSQYLEKSFKALLSNSGIRQSMCLEAWENAYAERINGTIKNEYLRHANSKSLKDLTRQLARSVKLYNEDRIHLGLPKKMTPKKFEENFLLLSSQERPRIRLYTEEVFTRGIEPLDKNSQERTSNNDIT